MNTHISIKVSTAKYISNLNEAFQKKFKVSPWFVVRNESTKKTSLIKATLMPPFNKRIITGRGPDERTAKIAAFEKLLPQGVVN